MKKRVKNALKLFEFPAPQSFKQGDLKQERVEKFKNHNDVLQFSPFGTKTSGNFKNMYLGTYVFYFLYLYSGYEYLMIKEQFWLFNDILMYLLKQSTMLKLILYPAKYIGSLWFNITLRGLPKPYEVPKVMGSYLRLALTFTTLCVSFVDQSMNSSRLTVKKTCFFIYLKNW